MLVAVPKKKKKKKIKIKRNKIYIEMLISTDRCLLWCKKNFKKYNKKKSKKTPNGTYKIEKMR